MKQQFNFVSFLGRWIFSAILVLLTYNPTGFSYLHWLKESLQGPERTAGAAHALAGVVVVIGWVILFRASYRSLGTFGLFLGAAFFGTLIWFLFTVGVLEAESRSMITWIALICLSGLLAIGLSWSHIRRRLTGQLDVDDIET